MTPELKARITSIRDELQDILKWRQEVIADLMDMSVNDFKFVIEDYKVRFEKADKLVEILTETLEWE